MQKTEYKVHIFSLSLLFVLGDAILFLPFDNLFSLLFTAVLSAGLIALTIFVTTRYQSNKILFFAVLIATFLLAAYGLATCVYDYVCYLSKEQLPDTSVVLLSISLFASAVFFVLSHNNAVFKYCLLLSITVISLIFITFFAGVGNFDFSFVKTFLFKPSFSIKSFFRFFVSLAVAIFFLFNTKKSNFARPAFWGALSGFFVLGLCFIQSILTLGSTTNIKHPYLKAVSVISTGSLFTRLDGFVYFLFFVTALIKICVCFKTIILIFKLLFTTKNPLQK